MTFIIHHSIKKFLVELVNASNMLNEHGTYKSMCNQHVFAASFLYYINYLCFSTKRHNYVRKALNQTK